jgi:hypothetical protein
VLEQAASDASVVLITGLSGAGRSRALKCFEDLGFEAVDNLPLALFRMLVQGRSDGQRRVAIGIDSRTRDFSAEGLLEAVAAMQKRHVPPFLLFLDCDDDVLIRRYKETRRRHPLADRPSGQRRHRLRAPRYWRRCAMRPIWSSTPRALAARPSCNACSNGQLRPAGPRRRDLTVDGHLVLVQATASRARPIWCSTCGF